MNKGISSADKLITGPLGEEIRERETQGEKERESDMSIKCLWCSLVSAPVAVALLMRMPMKLHRYSHKKKCRTCLLWSDRGTLIFWFHPSPIRKALLSVILLSQ